MCELAALSAISQMDEDFPEDRNSKHIFGSSTFFPPSVSHRYHGLPAWPWEDMYLSLSQSNTWNILFHLQKGVRETSGRVLFYSCLRKIVWIWNCVFRDASSLLVRGGIPSFPSGTINFFYVNTKRLVSLWWHWEQSSCSLLSFHITPW